MNVEFIDIIVGAILAYGLVHGYHKGIVQQLGALGGLIVAILFANLFAPLFENLLNQFDFAGPRITHQLAYLISFLVLLFGGGSWLAHPLVPVGALVLTLHLLGLGCWAAWRTGTRCAAAVVFGLGLTRFAADLGAAWAANAGLVAVSVAWALYALGLMAFGLWRGRRPLRLAALALFGITVLKVFVIDLGDVALVWRIVAALPVGALLILGAALYLRLGPPFDPGPKAD